jgi:hypothetical protein
MPKDSVGGSFFVVKPRSGTLGDEKSVESADEDKEFVML